MNNILTIAQKDVTDAFRSNTLWAAIGFMSVLVLARLISIGSKYINDASQPILLAVAQFDLWLPLFAIVIGYNSVVGERESGRIRLLLGLPSTRRDVVLGKFLGRSVVFLFGVSVSILLLTALIIVQTSGIGLAEIVGGTLVVFLYGLAWIGTTVGVSSFVSSGTRTIGVMFGLYTFFGPLWTQLGQPLLALAVTGSTTVEAMGVRQVLTYADSPTWFLYATRLSPFEAFSGANYYVTDLFEIALLGESTNAPHAPNIFGIGVLIAWAFLPVAFGYWRFKHTELG